MSPRRRRSLGAVLGLGALAGLAGASPAADPAPPCRAEVELAATRAVVGQQVVQRVVVLTRSDVADADWIAPDRLPGFRVEWLPGRPLPAPRRIAGHRYRAREERRALFPERPGRLTVAAGRVRCRVVDAGSERSVEAPLDTTPLQVAPPPAIGRPREWAGLVGPVSIQTLAAPSEVALGGSVRIAVMLRGGNVWQASDPLGAVAGADVFPRRPATTFERGETFAAVRHFAYDVVPLAAGELVVPGVRVPIFDPAAARYAEVVGDPLRIPVGPRPPSAPGAAPAGAPPPPAPAAAKRAAKPPRSGSLGWALAAATLGAAALAVARFRRTRARRRKVATALAAAGGETAAAWAGALRAALARHRPEVHALVAEEIAALPDLPEPAAAAAQLLLEVERARFDPHAPLPGRAAVERALAGL